MRLRVRLVLLVCSGLLAACATDKPGPSEPLPVNEAPTAAFAAACSGLTCTLTDESVDDDGIIETRRWDFGDGAASTESQPSHTYARPGGDFTVALVVTDDAGDSATTTREVTVRPEASALVGAAFTSVCTHLICVFYDASTGPVVSHVWDFGDGATSDRQSPVHDYAQPGAFTVTLTVIDGSSAESTVVAQVEVEIPNIGGTYERQANDGRNARIVIEGNGSFELLDWTGTDTIAYAGQWTLMYTWVGLPLGSITVIGLDFDSLPEVEYCGEGFGVFLTDAEVAIAFCGAAIQAGLREGVYSSAPSTATTLPPPQGGQIAFVRDGRIHRVNSDGSGLMQLTEGPYDGSPAWSPDGSRIAFHGGSAGEEFGIYVADADGSNVVRLTNGWDASWSPDGEWLVFVCYGAAGPYELCRVGTDSTSTEPVAFTQFLMGQTASPDWSPDGSRIALISDAGLYDIFFDIWTIAPDGSGFTSLVTHVPGALNPWAFHDPAWSPDGNRIAYGICPWAWYDCSSSALEIMNADGSGMTLLVTGSGRTSPAWSPDGALIAFTSGGNIEWVSGDGSQRGRIVEDGHSPSWRP